MTWLADSSVLIDWLCGMDEAHEALTTARRSGPIHASEITRVELRVGMRADEEEATNRLLMSLVWHSVDSVVAKRAGTLGRRWLPGNRGIGAADLVIAATAEEIGAELLTRNVKHFPMFQGLRAPY